VLFAFFTRRDQQLHCAVYGEMISPVSGQTISKVDDASARWQWQGAECLKQNPHPFNRAMADSLITMRWRLASSAVLRPPTALPFFETVISYAPHLFAALAL
jgi:hypothetical protein